MAKKFRVQCWECKQKFVGNNEFETELQFDQHVCPKAPNLKTMSLEELRARAYAAADAMAKESKS